MEAEAREILAAAMEKSASDAASTSEEAVIAERRRRIEEVVGRWKDRGTTDELMALTRGED